MDFLPTIAENTARAVDHLGKERCVLVSWDDVVARCLDTLVERGADVYGPVHSAMLMSILDVDTLVSPQDPVPYEAAVRTEGRPDHGRWSPGGSNLWHDMATLRAMYHLSRTKNRPEYALAADADLGSAFRLGVKTRRSAPGREGLLIWGSHCYYHCFKDRGSGSATASSGDIRPSPTTRAMPSSVSCCGP